MKIAVTSASGALGGAICKQMIKEIGAKNVVGIARTPEKAKHLDIEIRKGDYNSREDFDAALQGIDAVLLVSGMDAPDKRIGQHRNVIEAAKANGVKKIVYTSIFGANEGNAFSPVVASNRQTEEDIRNSGLDYAIGRNGIYIEPDLDYIDSYKKDGGIINSAADGRCGYTSRAELAYAYYKLLTDNSLNKGTYNLLGNGTTQQELAEALNKAYGLDLSYTALSVKDYTARSKSELGEFLGSIIGGIYEGIRAGHAYGHSDYAKVTGRAHKSLDELIADYKQ